MMELKGPITALVGRAGSRRHALQWSNADTRRGQTWLGATRWLELKDQWEPHARFTARWWWLTPQAGATSRMGRDESAIRDALRVAQIYMSHGYLAVINAVSCHPQDGRNLIEELYALAQDTGGKAVIEVNCPVQLDAIASLEDVICVSPRTAAMRRLSEHPQANKWRDLLRVGEFWSTVGEEWVDDPSQ